MRNSTLGCVLKRLENESDRNGLTINRCEVAALPSIGLLFIYKEIFSKAEAKLKGFLESIAPFSSALYSLSANG